MEFTLGRLSLKHEKLPEEVAILDGEIVYPNYGPTDGSNDVHLRIKENSYRYNATKRVFHEKHHLITIIWRDAGKYPWQAKKELKWKKIKLNK